MGGQAQDLLLQDVYLFFEPTIIILHRMVNCKIPVPRGV